MAHVLVVPYPSQGHMNPMVQFARKLASKGVAVTVVTTRFIERTTSSSAGGGGLDACPGVRVEAISDGHDEGGVASAASLEEYLATLDAAGPRRSPGSSPPRRAAPARPPPLHVRGVRHVRAVGGARGARPRPAGRGVLHAVVRRQRRVPLRPRGEARRAGAGAGAGDQQERRVRRAAGDGEARAPVVRARRRAVPDARRVRAQPVRRRGEGRLGALQLVRRAGERGK